MTNKTALVLGSYGYAVSLVPEYQIKMAGIHIRPKNSFYKDKLPDVVLFTGGEDISPSLYGEINYACNGVNKERDAWELEWYRWTLLNGIKMVGICRGMQLFTAMTGGKLLQHVYGHQGYHPLITKEGETFEINSIHHQMCVPKQGTYELLAFAPGLSKGYTTTPTIKKDFEERFYYEKARDGIKLKEPEALWFPEIRALGVQFHPEMLSQNTPAHSFFKGLLKTYITSN